MINGREIIICTSCFGRGTALHNEHDRKHPRDCYSCLGSGRQLKLITIGPYIVDVKETSKK